MFGVVGVSDVELKVVPVVLKDQNGDTILSEHHENRAHSYCHIIAIDSSNVDKHIVVLAFHVPDVIECGYCRGVRSVDHDDCVFISWQAFINACDVNHIAVVSSVQIETVQNCVIVDWELFGHLGDFAGVQFV